MSQTRMQKSPDAQLEAPRFENGNALLIAGLRSQATDQIPDLWKRFIPYLGKIPGQVGRKAYGLCWTQGNGPGTDYLAGVEVSSATGLPSDFQVVNIPAQRYAVFSHRGHVSKLYETCDAISKWLPQSGLQAVRAAEGAPDFFERYTEEFNPQKGMGGIEVWVPIKS